MPSNLLLMFNHQLTAVQKADAITTLEVADFITLPEDLQRLWSDVPPALEVLHDYLQPFEQWLMSSAKRGDYVLIQGDFGACYLMVNFALGGDLLPIYSTTRREALEEHHPDGSVTMMHHFRHGIFRKYGE